jgi:hypothetical protein
MHNPPLTQRCPAAQGWVPVEPHTHTPADVQVSASPAGHDWQVPPTVPRLQLPAVIAVSQRWVVGSQHP